MQNFRSSSPASQRSRLIADQIVRTNVIQSFLHKEFARMDLASVEEAKKFAARHSRQLEAHLKDKR